MKADQTLRILIITAIITAAFLGCGGPKVAVERPPDGVIFEGKTTLVEGGPAYARVEGYVTVPTTGIQHWYERTGPVDATTITLINGADSPANIWHNKFVKALLEAGFHVVRYDPRDCGRSQRLPWPEGFKIKTWTPDKAPPYPLSAIVDDLAGLLAVLDIEQTHLVGISMGGMIAQLMAIDYPERVLSLSLLSTSPSNFFDPELDNPDEEHIQQIAKLMKKAGMASAFSFILGDRWIDRLTEALQFITGASDGGKDRNRFIRETEEIGGHNFRSGQGLAISSAPSRIKDLPSIMMPTLVLHGTADPLFRFSHAETLAELIPNARLIAIDGEGHASPRDMYNPYVNHIIALITEAENSP